jgi:tetratricopeptide (TPR) repeat protein
MGLITLFTLRLAAARNEALKQAQRTRRIQQFTMNLFKGGEDSAVAPAKDLRIATVLDRGVAEPRALDHEPLVKADLFQTLGNIYQDVGRFADADNLFRSALAIRRSQLPSDDTSIASILVALGKLRVNQGKFREAEHLIRQGLSIDDRHTFNRQTGIANDWSALGLVLDHEGKHGEAIKLFERALRIQTASSPDSPELAATLTSMADARFYPVTTTSRMP